MTGAGRNRIHQVSCSVTSGPDGTASFAKAERLARDIQKYARKRGFSGFYENVDEAEERDEITEGFDVD